MPLHIVKLCVGAETVDDQAAWVERRVAANKAAGDRAIHDHVTRMTPKKREALLDGGSIYWVIKGAIQARQRFLGFDSCTGNDGISRCVFLLEPEVVLTEPQHRRAFQGWRYLTDADAPADLRRSAANGVPPELSMELAELGLL